VERFAVLPLLAAACLPAACAGDEGAGEQDTVVRVGTSHGLGELTPGPSRAGGAAYYVHELVYEPVSAYAEVGSIDGKTVTLVAKDTSRAEVLAENLIYHGLEDVRLLGALEVALSFRSAAIAEAAAKSFANGQHVVATGPFRIVSTDREIRLQAIRGDLAIDAIKIRSLDTTELWRRLHGRDIDVIPLLDEIHREQFEGMHSVRILDMPHSGFPSLIFNARTPRVADRAVRGRLARAIDRGAIARVACGRADCEAAFWLEDELPELVLHDEEVMLPATLELVVLETDSAAVLAAGVLRHQLRQEGVRLNIVTATIDDLLSPQLADYDLLLLPLPPSPARAAVYLEQFQVLPAGAEHFERARRIGGDEAWQRAFGAELPALPLYEMRAFAAIDGRFCGGSTPERASSWAWLAELHPCEVASR
jgi:hypothetical protein